MLQPLIIKVCIFVDIRIQTMKKLFISFILLSLLSACASRQTEDPDTLPKDISLKPERNDPETDRKMMAELIAEIEAMIGKETCTDASQWRISAIGTKACGGPSSYITYPISLETELLPKIKEVTRRQSEFNRKYGVMSDCAIVPPPSAVRCENGKAVLVGSKTDVQEVAY